MIWDVGGVTPTLCENLIARLRQQVKTYDPGSTRDTRVTEKNEQFV